MDDPSVHVEVPFETRREEKGNLAAFGNVTYEVGAWEWGFGLRIDRWESDEEAVDIGHSASKDDVEILPKLSLTRHFNNDSMAYLTVSKGFEPGGWVGIADGAPLYTDQTEKKHLPALIGGSRSVRTGLEGILGRWSSSGNRRPVFH